MSDKKRKITPCGENIIRHVDETAGTTGINAADSCAAVASANDYRELLCKLKEIAITLGSPLYIVGGAVRDFVFSKEKHPFLNHSIGVINKILFFNIYLF